jgi:preprotein translocase subunit SecE
VARDRKRAKQRAQRRGAARSGGGSGSGEGRRSSSQLTRADLPGALEHVGDVDEFDAAMVRGADGVTVPDGVAEAAEAVEDARAAEDEQEPVAAGAAASGNGSGNGVSTAPVRTGGRDAKPPARSGQSLPRRAMAFLRASWAELQRVQWPNRSQVTQATAVVLGFVAVAGVYFGVADYVAKEIVEAIL